MTNHPPKAHIVMIAAAIGASFRLSQFAKSNVQVRG
jgi:hypothetical protein